MIKNLILLIFLIISSTAFAQPTRVNTGQYVLDMTATGGAVATQTTDGWNIFSENDHFNLLNIGSNTHVQIDSHISDLNNPHVVTTTQLGLENVDNTSDLDKPISTATQTALDLKYDASNPSGFLNETSHDALPADNPHSVTKAQVGLGNADNTSDLNKPISTATQTALDLKYDASNPNSYETSTELDARDTANRARANHTGVQSISTITETPTAPGNSDNLFIFKVNSAGTGYETFQPFEDFYTDTVCRISQTANSFEAYTTYSPTVPAAGEYILYVEYTWSGNDGAQDFRGRLVVDGVPQGIEHRQEPKDPAGTGIVCDILGGGTINTSTDQRHPAMMMRLVTFADTTPVIEFEITNSQINDRATIYGLNLHLKRRLP